ncbi:hypothetical protein F7725_004989, partial [Dissostichus mawsoni]
MQSDMMACTKCLCPTGDNSSSAGQSNFLGFSSFNIRDLLRPKEPQVSLNLRTMDGVNEVGEVMVSRLQIEEETPPDHKCLSLCDSLHTSIHDKENSPMMRAVLCSQVCKVYRFQTEDQRWLLVREQMSETPLSFSLPKQLLSLLIRSHTSRLRHDVICHCNHLIGCYQETLADLDNLSASSSFKSSCSKSDRQLHVVSYSQEESSRARELLANVAQLQPLVFGLAEELLSVSLEQNNARLQPVLHSLTQQTKQFVHALKDELVKSALIASHDHSTYVKTQQPIRRGRRHGATGRLATGGRLRRGGMGKSDRAWANVGMSLNCIIAMGDRLLGKEEVTSSENQESDHSQNTGAAAPLVVTLRDCVREAKLKARVAMTFVMMQAAAAMTVSEGTTNIVQRRHAAFSQADQDFLQQLISAGLLVQFEALLSTYGEEVVVLEDMEVCVSDLSRVTSPSSKQRAKNQKICCQHERRMVGQSGGRGAVASGGVSLVAAEVRDGRLIRVHPVLFNIGINSSRVWLKGLGQLSAGESEPAELRASESLLQHAERHAASDGWCSVSRTCCRLWNAAWKQRRGKSGGSLDRCGGVSFCARCAFITSCKSAKDRTAMSVTLEQAGCRMENVQKNIGSRKFAFSGVQLLTFPKLYRPPEEASDRNS